MTQTGYKNVLNLFEIILLIFFREYSDDENDSPVLMSKYRNAKDLVNEIYWSTDTPDCEEILENRNEWVLDKNEFNAKEEFEKFLNSNQNQKSILYHLVYFLYNSRNFIDSEVSDSDES